LIGKIPPRPLLLVHGANDDVVPILDARALADTADEGVELRILAAAEHRLRHDPRAIAILLGWLDRQLL
jgi:putative redox protein